MYVAEATLLELNNQISSLRTMMLNKHPVLGNLLSEIKKALEKHPENVTLLKEEDMGTIFDAIKIETGIQFTADVVGGTKKQSSVKTLKEKIKNLGMDAF